MFYLISPPNRVRRLPAANAGANRALATDLSPALALSAYCLPVQHVITKMLRYKNIASQRGACHRLARGLKIASADTRRLTQPLARSATQAIHALTRFVLARSK
eukprot:3855804-Pleurochrysis_carterae.AAC.1